MSRDINCLEYSIEEYDSTGGFASTTICIETCASDAGSSRRSSKKSTSTRRHRRRKKSQLWLSSAEDDLSVATVLRAATGKARCTVKTPFSAGGAGRPYNKKLRKKTFQHQGHVQQCPLQCSEAATTAATSPIEVSFQETSRMITQAAASSFFISETHRAVAEATTPWIQSHGSGSTRYQFLGHGGLTANNAHGRKKRTGRSGHHNNNNNNDDDDDADWPEFLDIAAMGGGSRRMEPMQSPSMLPPAHLLPASKADLSSDLLERCFLETRLSDDDHFSLL